MGTTLVTPASALPTSRRLAARRGMGMTLPNDFPSASIMLIALAVLFAVALFAAAMVIELIHLLVRIGRRVIHDRHRTNRISG